EPTQSYHRERPRTTAIEPFPPSAGGDRTPAATANRRHDGCTTPTMVMGSILSCFPGPAGRPAGQLGADVMNAKGLWELLKEAGSEWVEDKAPRLGAALAYYTVFSIAPLLVIAVGVAGIVFGREATEGYVAGQIEHLVGPEGGQAIQAMVASASRREAGVLGTVLGLGMLAFGAVGVFVQLKDALNTVWGVEPKPGRGLWGFVRDYILSLAMVLGTAFLLLVSLVVSAALAA